METIESLVSRIVREELQELAECLEQSSVRNIPSPVGDGLIWLRSREIASRARRHPGTVIRALEGGELHGKKNGRGGHLRAHTDCVDAWFEGKTCAHAQGKLQRYLR